MKRPILATVLAAIALAGILSASRTQSQAPVPAPTVAVATVYNPILPPWSAKFDGATDDWQAITACLAACPDGGVVDFPINGATVISQPIALTRRWGLTIRSMGTPDTNALGKRGTEIIVKGAGCFDCQNTRRCTIEGLAISCDAPGTSPAWGVRYETIVAPLNSTQNRIKRCLVMAPAVPGSFTAVSNGLLDKDNHPEWLALNTDFLTIEDTTIQSNSVKGWGTAYLNGNPNVKLTSLSNVSISYATTGVWCQAGSVQLERCSGAWNATDVRIDKPSDPCFLLGCRWENSGQCLNLAGSDAPVTVVASSWGAVNPGPAVNSQTRQLVTIGDKFSGLNPGTPPVAQWPAADYGWHRIASRWTNFLGINDAGFKQRNRDALEWDIAP